MDLLSRYKQIGEDFNGVPMLEVPITDLANEWLDVIHDIVAGTDNDVAVWVKPNSLLLPRGEAQNIHRSKSTPAYGEYPAFQQDYIFTQAIMVSKGEHQNDWSQPYVEECFAYHPSQAAFVKIYCLIDPNIEEYIIGTDLVENKQKFVIE